MRLDDSQHGMVGWEVGEQYTLQFQMQHGANDRRPLTGHTFPSARRASPLGEENTRRWSRLECHGHIARHGD